MKKRILAMALTAAMMLSLFPASAFALPESQPTASSSEIVAQLNESASGDSQPAASEKTNSEPTAASEKAASSEAASSEAASSEAASSEAASSEVASSEAASSEAASSEAASSEAASSEAVSSEAVSSEPASSEPAQAEGDISVASENGERKICLPPFCPSKPKGQWVYVYTKVQSNNPELIKDLVINKDGYYTLGRVWVEGMKSPEPNFIGIWHGSIKTEKAKVINALNNNKIERYTLNQNIDLTKVDFSDKGELKREEHGATDYDVDEGWTWHLDGMLNIEDIGAVTFKYVCNGEKIAELNEKVPFSAGKTLTFTKDSADYNAYVKQVDGYTCIGVTPETYTVKSAQVGEVTFQYAKKLLEGNINAPAAEDLIYDGQEHKWVPTVTDGSGNPLTQGQDYELAYSHDDSDFTNVTNKDITVTITGKGNYTGTVTRKYKITPRPVTLTSATASKPYDGTPLEKPGVTVGGMGFVEGEAPQCVTQENARITNKGERLNDIVVSWEGSVGKSENYDIKYHDGTLTITPRKIKLTSATDSKQYDGEPLTNATVTAQYVGEDGKVVPTEKAFVDGEGAAYTVTGKQTDAGSSKNTFTYTLNENTLEKNYEIECEFGTLTVTPKNVNPEIGTGMTVEGIENVKYNGKAQMLEPVVKNGEKTLTKDADYTLTYSHDGDDFTNVTGKDITVHVKGIGNYEGEVTRTYQITKRSLILKAASETRVYNGESWKNETYTIDGLVPGETPNVSVQAQSTVKDVTTGEGVANHVFLTQSQPGNFNADNYTIEAKPGYLKVIPATLTITTKSASKTYDGNDLTEPNGYSIAGLVKGETVNFSITGRQKEVGSSDNTYVIDWNKSTAKQSNYTIVNNLGKLTVEARSGGSSSGGSSSGGSSSTPTPAPEQAPTPTPAPVIVPAAPAPAPTRVRRVAPAATATPAPTAKPTETIAESEPPKAESEPEVIEDEETPLAPMAGGAWALVNLVLMILTVLASLLMLLGVIGKKHGRNNKSFWRIASLIPAIGALAAFVLTENMKLPMAMVDRWTLLMVIIAVLQLIVAAMSKKQNESEDDGANA